MEYDRILSSIVTISYGLTIFFLGILAYRFLKLKMNIIPLLYGLAFSTLRVNALLNCISINLKLENFLFLPFNAPPSCLQFEAPPSCSGIEFSLGLTWLISFLLLWASSIFLIYSYRSALGKRFWIFVTLPITSIIYLILPIYSPFLISLLLSNVVLGSLVFSILFYFTPRFIVAYAFGASFWILRKIITDSHKGNFVMIAGIGLFFYLLSVNQSPILPTVGDVFPASPVAPYGIITLSIVGLFAYMINIIHNEDPLRKVKTWKISTLPILGNVTMQGSIENVSMRSSHLFDLKGTETVDKIYNNLIALSDPPMITISGDCFEFKPIRFTSSNGQDGSFLYEACQATS